ncbi:uncharacterized protein LOC128201042 [Galleria mellonella]|uniref:Uncharacterized protein LOC128201042 n=1 Tax=Galleria mellonella TaxID=7137 RepID=A0ABM3MMK2_GALME|nr:uncharacterized protein LOC128201042 [Galleria mellonella]
MKFIAFIFLIKITVSQSLTCNNILELPAETKLTIRELQTIQPKDMVQCLAYLGKEQLPKSEAEFIWQSIVAFYSGIANVPDNVLILLHWVTTALTPEDYANITFSNIDVIQNFGLNYNLDMQQLMAIADRVREDFAGKEPEDYTYYDLTALRQILCAYNRSEIERIHPSAFREAALILGKLENCSAEVMTGFASLAIQKSAFGPPSTWSDSTKKALGKIIEFLPPEIIEKYKL